MHTLPISHKLNEFGLITLSDINVTAARLQIHCAAATCFLVGAFHTTQENKNIDTLY